MQIAMLGLGKMGANMAQRLLRGGHAVLAYDINPAAVQAVEAFGARGVRLAGGNGGGAARAALGLGDGALRQDHRGRHPRLAGLLSPGDTLIDGGNSYYKDLQRRAAELAAEAALNFIDAGTSGGIWGLEEGYSLMIGGEKRWSSATAPSSRRSRRPRPGLGSRRAGRGGSLRQDDPQRHRVRHDGGLRRRLRNPEGQKGIWPRPAPDRRDLALRQRGPLLAAGSDRAGAGRRPRPEGIKAWVADSGEGRWTAFEAIDLDVSAPVITLSLQQRIRSRDEDPFSDRLVAAMRHQFGGHAVKKE